MLFFLLNIAGAAALLIYAVRMVRTGVERAFAVQLRRWLRASARHPLVAAASGASVALVRTMLRILSRIISAPDPGETGEKPSALDPGAQAIPQRALACAARDLVRQKKRARQLEQALQYAHLARLRQDKPETPVTSNIHQEALRELKQINTHFIMVAYPILTESGDLLETRLKRGRP